MAKLVDDCGNRHRVGLVGDRPIMDPRLEISVPFVIRRSKRSNRVTKVLRDAGFNGKATAHGFRSSFKDWCAEVAKVRDEVSEAALAHKIPDKVRAAYLRTRFLYERPTTGDAALGEVCS
jgi:integrase